MAVSADGLFAGVALTGLALVTRGAVRGRLLSGAMGGLLLGVAVFLSYGLVLFGVPVILVVVLTVRRHGWRRTAPSWIAATVGLVAVVAVHLAYGFNWLTGLAQLRIRYYQGIASGRPFSYFVYADLAAWLVSCSPLLAIGVGRALEILVHRRARSRRRTGWLRCSPCPGCRGPGRRSVRHVEGRDRTDLARVRRRG